MVYLYECKIYTTGRMFAPDLFFYFFAPLFHTDLSPLKFEKMTIALSLVATTF